MLLLSIFGILLSFQLTFNEIQYLLILFYIRHSFWYLKNPAGTLFSFFPLFQFMVFGCDTFIARLFLGFLPFFIIGNRRLIRQLMINLLASRVSILCLLTSIAPSFDIPHKDLNKNLSILRKPCLKNSIGFVS